MVRFRCIHCNGRIAVHGRHLGRLARCPECGGVTHPLAEHLVASPKVSVAAITNARPAASDCANCGQLLGKLEQPHNWEEHLVCGPCRRTLSELAESSARPGLALSENDRPRLEGKLHGESRVQAMLVDARHTQPARLPASIVIDLHALVAVFVAAVLAAGTIYLVYAIIHSIGVLLAWSAVAFMTLLMAYGCRRAMRAIRRRVGALRPASKTLPVGVVVRG